MTPDASAPAFDAPAFNATSRRRILTVLFVGVFMAALDAAIIAPAIPALRAAFGVDNRQIGLVTIVFGLCSLSSTALMANLSDRFGRRPIYLANIGGFALGSLLIALSSTFGMVLLGRAIQGVSAGGITPTASAVVGDMFPPEERGRILGLIGATFGMAFLVGPLLASLMLIVLSWQWIFLINLPIAALILLMSARALPASRSDIEHPPFDYAGITVVAVMLTSLTMGINRVLDNAFGVTVWPGLLLLAALCVPLLIRIERRAAQPIVPLTLFANRQLTTTYVLCVGAGFGMGSVIFISSVAVAAFGTRSENAGLLLLPLVLCSSAASMGFGRIQNRLGARVVMLWGFGTLMAGSALIGTMAAHFWLYMLATLLIGAGVGIVVGGTLRTVVLDEVASHERGVASGLVNIGIAMGNLLVVAVLSALADRAGGGLSGLSVAYLAATAVMLLMMAMSVRLKAKVAAMAVFALLTVSSRAGHAQTAGAPALPADSVAFIRVNQVGYLPDAPKVAVLCALEPIPVSRFTVETESGRVITQPMAATRSGAFGPCADTWRLDFSRIRTAGRYRLRAGRFTSPIVHVAADRYRGLADTLMAYMRQQRSGYNPFLRDSAHRRDGIIVDHPTRTGEFLSVSGGWADAADYLQYVTTSATATYHLLSAWRDAPLAFADAFDARGLPGRNGTPDVLDEARHGLAWLLRMFPDDSTMFNQLGDDRDHAFWDLITTDSSDYGWGKGRERPVYPCTGKPQGLLRSRNRSTGYASTAGKMAAAFALGARVFEARDRDFAETLHRKAVAAYALGERHPGVCQTAPGTSPYFYEEDNWVDDMELGASLLHQLTGEPRYLRDAMQFARREPVTPWMGADTASHYQWYPFHNAGHYEAWTRSGPAGRAELAAFYRDGLTRVSRRATNGFRIGIPFIWCSNDLLVSFASQATLYRRMTGDQQFREFEQAALDWLFGANPWGTSMVIGVPRAGVWPRDPHTELPDSLHHGLTGGLLDGPVYRSIYQNLRGIRLQHVDEFARFNTGYIVYHDDLGDYATNEHIMDGTANLAYLLATLDGRRGTKKR